MSKIDDLVQYLAVTRAGLSKAKAELKEMKRRFEATPKWTRWAAFKKICASEEAEADMALREYAVTLGKGHPHDAVEVQEWTAIYYDKAQAIEWCFHHNLRSALNLNVGLFEAHAKGVQKTAPIPFVQFGKELKTIIKSNLSAYLPEETDD